jgi:putative nucleotidyltransferase with HDIG domain
MRSVRRPALRIAGIYAVFATAWIIVTDRLAGGATSASLQTTLVEMSKGLLFVAVTALGLFLLVARHDRHRDEARATQERILEEALSGWAAALDLRDHSTAEHTHRVTDLTVALAEHLGVSGEDLVAMRRGATLHDIGKMAVPDSVLTKPGPLDDDEWVLMRRHPEMALQFLAGLDDLQSVSEIPFSHHEKYDGSGYPRGLRGEEIPYGARIFAIIDAYDALTSDRPYRAARSHEEAMEILAVDRGTHFDPEVFDAFSELMRSPQGQVHV